MAACRPGSSPPSLEPTAQLLWSCWQPSLPFPSSPIAGFPCSRARSPFCMHTALRNLAEITFKTRKTKQSFLLNVLVVRSAPDSVLARNVAYKGCAGRCLHATCAVQSWRQRCFARPDAFKAMVPCSHCAVDVSRTLSRPRAAPCLHLTQIKRAGGAQRTAFASKVARCL